MKPNIQSVGDSGRSGSESDQSSNFMSNNVGAQVLNQVRSEVEVEDYSGQIERLEDKNSDHSGSDQFAVSIKNIPDRFSVNGIQNIEMQMDGQLGNENNAQEEQFARQMEGGQQHAYDVSDVNGTQVSGMTNSTSFTRVQPIHDEQNDQQLIDKLNDIAEACFQFIGADDDEDDDRSQRLSSLLTNNQNGASDVNFFNSNGMEEGRSASQYKGSRYSKNLNHISGTALRKRFLE